MEATQSSKALVYNHHTTWHNNQSMNSVFPTVQPWRWRQYGLPTCLYPTTNYTAKQPHKSHILYSLLSKHVEAVWSSEMMVSNHCTNMAQQPRKPWILSSPLWRSQIFKLWSSSLCIFLHPHVTSSLLSSYFLLSPSSHPQFVFFP